MHENKSPFLVRLSWLERAQNISETIATPHRLFDVDGVKEAVGQDDPLVAMQLMFTEHANTGIRSPLQRFHCDVLDESSGTSVTVAVDLIDGLIDLAPNTEHEFDLERKEDQE